MKTATTLQFRKAVRKYAAKHDITIGESWTNQTTIAGAHRTVGFWMPSATPSIARGIEKKLNKKGRTAQTRCTDSEYTSSAHYRALGTYIRGTCVLA